MRLAHFPPTCIEVAGQYRTHFVPWSLHRQSLTRLLPDMLELAPQCLVSGDRHPVLLSFGRQERVFPLVQSDKGMAYFEFIVAVPYLQWKSHVQCYRGPFVYLPRLYLDQWLPMILGWLCGFAKERAYVISGENEYHITSYSERVTLISASFAPCGKTGTPDEFAGFGDLREIFAQPLVTHTPVGSMCLDFRWHLEQARVQAIAADVRIEWAFLPGMEVEEFRVDGIDKCAMGAFYLDVPWTLSRPFRPSSIRPV
jgi:hypothetical protein